MQIYGYCYLAENTLNGKAYVGQTVASIKRRWNRHLNDAANGSEYPLHRAIRLYGADAFTVREIYRNHIWTESQTELRQHELDDAEIHYIAAYDCINPEFGYNLTTGGKSRGHSSDATRKKQSDSCTDNWAKPSYRNAQLELITTAEVKAKQRQARQALWDTADGREMQLKALNSPAALLKKRESVERYYSDPKVLEEMKARARTLWADPLYKQRVLAKRAATLERRRKESAA